MSSSESCVEQNSQKDIMQCVCVCTYICIYMYIESTLVALNFESAVQAAPCF
jgi:hypothetical protein